MFAFSKSYQMGQRMSVCQPAWMHACSSKESETRDARLQLWRVYANWWAMISGFEKWYNQVMKFPAAGECC